MSSEEEEYENEQTEDCEEGENQYGYEHGGYIHEEQPQEVQVKMSSEEEEYEDEQTEDCEEGENQYGYEHGGYIHEEQPQEVQDYEYGRRYDNIYDEQPDNQVDLGNNYAYEDEAEDQETEPYDHYSAVDDDAVESQSHVDTEDDNNLTEEAKPMSYAADTGDSGGGTGNSGGLGSVVQGVMDGFGGSNLGDIVNSISQIAKGDGGGLTNLMSSGGMETIVQKMLGEAAHRFLGINPETGAIIGAIAGNIIFNMGGRGNSLTNIGKIILDNIISGKYKRDVHPFIPPVPTPGSTTFGLDFYTERERCLANRVLFEDPEFPATDRSLYYKTHPVEHIEWKRPGEIIDDPQLIVGDKSRFDVKQGALGDCWLLAAVANLTLRDELFYRVVPPDQSFTENYAGIFHFQFWRYGRWIDVVIDDRLPTVDGKLCYMHSHEHNEFWSALLEKAYAKLYGSYENLEGGTTAEALEDFTGGLTEFYDLRKTDKSTVLAMMIRGFQMGSLFGCSLDADPHQKEAPLENGLVRGHAYSITALHTVNGRDGETPIVRIRNPWGNSKEWNGAWSDGSPEWDYVDEQQRSELGVQFAKDGEFWMSFEDFYSNFMQMEICNLSAAIMNEVSEMTGVNVSEQQLHQWEEMAEDGEWSTQRGTAGGCANNPEQQLHQWEEMAEDGEWSTQRGTAGGCANNPDSYAQNPQYGSYFIVTDESVEHDGKCTVIVAVLQKYRRELRTVGKDSLPIGFAVYEVDSPINGAVGADFLLGRKPIARTRVFINMREVTCRFRVRAGHYIILPCTFEPNSDGEFLLRIYVNGKLQTRRLQ
ncbi:calpain family cysteine protease [Dictyocaulus viviparus]|uniref:Calpain family cysteine protease n=1 Tax=Dictyocaulus viviparus TaxID=29172 RepID=A0A0D8XXK2_DICVI|nr:calpain family cysteine protease [Dictyocaulus viviparus]